MTYREELIRKSRVREAFAPNKPIDTIELFCGRKDEVNRIVEGINTDGLHVLLYGDRGVGKTSLARITTVLMENHGNISAHYIKTCDNHDTFVTIVQTLFEKMGIRCVIKKSSSWDFSFLWNIFRIQNGTKTEYITADNISSPSWVADKIENQEGVFLIDEIDVLQDIADKHKIAQLIKQLSDKNSKLKIFIVGISRNAQELLGGHPSVQRCIKEVRLDRMTSAELESIIEKGEERLNLPFSKEIKRVIVKASAGFPFFTQLLSLKSAEEAIVNNKNEVTMNEFKAAVKHAVDDLEGSLKEQYQRAIIGNNMDKKKNILLAAALCGEDIFSAKQLKYNYTKVTKVDISQPELNKFLTGDIISSGFSTILQRVGKGVYRFNDPRMPSYVKLKNNYIEE